MTAIGDYATDAARCHCNPLNRAACTARSPINCAALIRAGEYPVGARLPPERDLAAQLKVSRPSVREALIALEVEGLVEVRMGSASR